uniref:Uncharacterized protein n=1 Tax=Acrobeloides nanus TaxID=290746 RepID=A0A914E825_9BILA
MVRPECLLRNVTPIANVVISTLSLLINIFLSVLFLKPYVDRKLTHIRERRRIQREKRLEKRVVEVAAKLKRHQDKIRGVPSGDLPSVDTISTSC